MEKCSEREREKERCQGQLMGWKGGTRKRSPKMALRWLALGATHWDVGYWRRKWWKARRAREGVGQESCFEH